MPAVVFGEEETALAEATLLVVEEDLTALLAEVTMLVVVFWEDLVGEEDFTEPLAEAMLLLVALAAEETL